MELVRNLMLALKQDQPIDDKRYLNVSSIPMSEWVAEYVSRQRSDYRFQLFNDAVLVPAPRSSLITEDSLWVPNRIAKALVTRGIGMRVLPCLKRITAVPKAATSRSEDRPTPSKHFQTLAVQGNFEGVEKIVVIDDIITRGATLLGSANRLLEAFPNVQISGFAAMRTISHPDDFSNFLDPCIGFVNYRSSSDDSLRRP
jgi:predicted amidophosphoribosyltransferase